MTARFEPRRKASVLGSALDVFSGAARIGITLLALVALFAPFATAQLAGTGAISGIVTDSTGAVIPDATVTATNVGTNVKTVRTTTGAGDYNITPLPPGVYTVTVQATGFQQFVQQNITVDALATVGLPIKLTIGRTDETVTVSSAPPVLSTEDATLGAVMDNEMYSNLPLQMGQGGNNDQRRATDFEYLMPGVQGNYTSGNATSNSGIVNGSGPSGGVSEIYIEGINLPEGDGVGDPRFTWTAISVDAVDQFQVQTAGISAQYSGQGMQNYSVKSGSNAYHGSIYEYIRNTMFDTWGFTSKVPTINAAGTVIQGGIKPREIMNEFGIVLSGPVIKNRLFLFGNYGQYRNQNGARPSTMTIPTLAQLGFADTNGTPLGYADYSAYAAANNGGAAHIYDPASSNYLCTGTSALPCQRTQFANDRIPASRISAAALNYAKFMLPYEKIANQSSLTNNLVYGTPTGLANWYATGRIDYTQSSRNQIGFVIAFGRQASTGPNSGSGLGAPFNTSQSYSPVTTVDIAKDTFTFTPHLINQFAIGFGRYQSDSVTPNRVQQYSATANGILNMPTGQASDGFPAIKWSGGYDNPGTWGGYNWNNKINNTFTVTDTVQWLVGKHNLTLGGQFVDVQFNIVSPVSYSSPMTFTFSANQTASYTTPTGSTALSTTNGSPVASFMLGAVNSSSVTVGSPGLGSRWADPSFWAQDDYKVNSKLTLNLGLRWDIYPSIKEAHNVFSFFNPNGTNSITGNKGTLSFAGSGTDPVYCNCTRPSPIYWKNIAPRIGAAYSVNDKTVIRASYNVNYARGDWTSGSQSGSPSTLGFIPGATALSSPVSNNVPSFYWDGTNCTNGTYAGTPCGWTGSVAQPTPPGGASSMAEYGTTNFNSTNSSPGSPVFWDPYRGSRTPQYLNWTFGVQRQLTHDMSVNISYVGSQGHFLSASGANPHNNNKLTSSWAALAGYNVANGVATPCSGAGCSAPLLGQKSTAANVALATGLGFAAQNPYSSATYYTGNSVYQYFLPFPQLSGLNDTTSFAGNTNFNALEISVRQRTSHGLDFMLNYTYSKSMDDVGGFRLAEQPRLDRSISVTDMPQNLVGTAVYHLPFGHGHIGGDNSWVNALAGGWLLSGIYTYHSGTPLAVTGSGCGGSSILGNCMPSVVPGVSVRNGTKYAKNVTANPSSSTYFATIPYLNTGAFSVTNAGTTAQYGTQGGQNNQVVYVGNGTALYAPGNAPRVGAGNTFSMGAYNVDMAIKRSFNIYREWKLQFEADCLNATNHTVFGSVNGGVGSSSYGYVTAVSNLSRDWQFSGRLSF